MKLLLAATLLVFVSTQTFAIGTQKSKSLVERFQYELKVKNQKQVIDFTQGVLEPLDMYSTSTVTRNGQVKKLSHSAFTQNMTDSKGLVSSILMYVTEDNEFIFDATYRVCGSFFYSQLGVPAKTISVRSDKGCEFSLEFKRF